MTKTTRPARGTPEYDLWIAAIEIAAHAPLSRGPSTGSAQISWPMIDSLRGALDTLGIDWRNVKAVQDERAQARLKRVAR